MRLLMLLRHAKSSWADPSLDDHDRPLAPRGRKAAPAMGRWLAAQELRPDLVLCSTATRARETLTLLRDGLGHEVPVRHLRSLYEASAPELLDAVGAAPAAAARLLVIGHNPALEDVARCLAAAEDSEARRRLMAKFPTAAMAVLAFEAPDWRVLRAGSGRLHAFVRPRDVGR